MIITLPNIPTHGNDVTGDVGVSFVFPNNEFTPLLQFGMHATKTKGGGRVNARANLTFDLPKGVGMAMMFGRMAMM